MLLWGCDAVAIKPEMHRGMHGSRTLQTQLTCSSCYTAANAAQCDIRCKQSHHNYGIEQDLAGPHLLRSKSQCKVGWGVSACRR